MNKYAIIRDDDINYFTSTNMLESIYDEILEQDIPINFSVIPNVSTDVQTKYFLNSGFPSYEVFIPQEMAGKNKYFPINNNLELLEYINNNKEKLELIQHGYSHSENEFYTFNISTIKNKIFRGRNLIKKSFHVNPVFFSAPYDAYSPISIFLCNKYFNGITYGEFNINKSMIKFLPISYIPNYITSYKRHNIVMSKNKFLIIGYKKEASIDPFIDIKKIKKIYLDYLNNDNNVIVLFHHYWVYYYSVRKSKMDNKLNQDLHEAFLEIIYLLKNNGVKFIKISDLYRMINKI